MLVRLKQALQQNRVVRVFALGQLCSPKLAEMVGFQGGYDAVWLDQEHVGLTIEQIENSARAAPSTPPRVRPNLPHRAQATNRQGPNTNAKQRSSAAQ